VSLGEQPGGAGILPALVLAAVTFENCRQDACISQAALQVREPRVRVELTLSVWKTEVIAARPTRLNAKNQLSRASCRIRTDAADLQDRSHNHLDQRSKLRNSKNADGRTRTRIDSFRRRAPDPFGHIRKLRSQGSNLESLGSKPSVLPITPLRNVSGWGRIRTGCLWWFRPALFQMSFPTHCLLLSAFCLLSSISVSRYIKKLEPATRFELA
jgi:hypothetical protein